MTDVSRLTRAAYRTQQLSYLVQATVLQETARLLSGTPRPKLPPATLALLRRRVEALFARDLDNVATGMYPRELLFQLPARDYARVLPRLLRDGPSVIRRRSSRR